MNQLNAFVFNMINIELEMEISQFEGKTMWFIPALAAAAGVAIAGHSIPSSPIASNVFKSSYMPLYTEEETIAESSEA